MSLPAADDPAAYRFWTPDRVRFADLDLLGHVNNTAYAIYVESGRAAFFHEIGIWVPGAPVQSVVARLEIDFRRELSYPADFKVGVRVLGIGHSSYRIGCGIFADEVCCASALTVVVRWDMAKRGSTPLADEDRARLLPYLSA